MKICPKCNVSNEDSSIVCQNCGNQIDSIKNSLNNGQQNIINNNFQKSNTNGMAIASFVLGIVSFISVCCCVFFSIPIAIVGLILGLIGKSEAEKQNNPTGKGFAIAGIIINIVAIVFSALSVVLIFVFRIFGDSYYSWYNY